MRHVSAAWALIALALVACSTNAPAPSPNKPSDLDRGALVEPLMGYPLAVSGDLQSRLTDLFRGLDGSAPGGFLPLEAVVRGAEDLLETDPGFYPADIVLAQIDFIRGNDQAVVDRLMPVRDELPTYEACQWVLARAAERLDDIPLAFDAYLSLAEVRPEASRRSGRLRSRALDIVANRVAERLERGRVEEAEESLSRLLVWDESHPLTLDARRSVSVASGDLEGELEAIRRLLLVGPPTTAALERGDLRPRAAELEIEVGDLRTGMRQLETLLEEQPGHHEWRDKLEQAMFRYRLQLLPEEVQRIAEAGELTRADFASLLYWLVPEVRFTRVSNPPIATDILDHPRRQEILHVMNLGLLSVDERLHRFNPERRLTRGQAFGSLLHLLQRSETRQSCFGGAEDAGGSPTQHLACRVMARCRLIAEEAECLPRAELSGREAIDLFRRTLELLEPDAG